MSVMTERVRTQKTSDLINLDTYTSDEDRLIFSKAEGDRAYVGRVYVASPLIGAGNEFGNVVTNLLKSLPDDSIVQVSLMCTPAHEAPNVFTRNKFAGGQACDELIQLQQSMLQDALQQGWKPNLPVLNRRRVIISAAMPISRITAEVIEDAKRLHTEFHANLRGCGFVDATPLTAAQLVSLYRQQARIHEPETAVELDELVDIRYQIFGPDDSFDFRDRSVGVFSGDTYCAAVTAKAFPRKVNHGLMNLVAGAPLNKGSTVDGGGQRIPGPYILTTTVRVANQRKEIDRVNNAIESRKQKQPLPFKLGDEDPAVKLEDLKTLQTQCAKDGNKYVYVSTVAFLFGRDREQVINASASLKSTLDKLGFDARNVVGNALVRWAQTLPLNFSTKVAEQLANEAVMCSEVAGCLFPVYGDHLGNVPLGAPVTGLSFVTRRGSQHCFDPFKSESNYNGVLSAGSGAGKSVFLQYFALCHLAQGDNVFVIDNGRSQKKLARALDGEFNAFGGDDGFTPSLNPFTGLSDEDFDEQQENITSLLLQMAFDNEPPAPGARIALSEAIKATWAQKTDRAELLDVIESLKTTRDAGLQTTVKTEVVLAATNLIPRLTAFIESPSRGRFFRGPGTLDPKKRFTVFELAGLDGDPHLKKCVLFFVLNLLLTRIRAIKGRKLILVDESFDVLKDPAAEKVVEGLSLKCRKDLVSMWLVVQSLLKLVNESPGGRVLLNMAAWKIVLAQGEEETQQVLSEKVISSFGNDPYFVKLLQSVETRKGDFSEALIFGNGSYEVGRLYLHKLVAALMSSEGAARDEVFALMDRGVPVMDAVRQVLGDAAANRRSWLKSVIDHLRNTEGLSPHEIVREIQAAVS